MKITDNSNKVFYSKLKHNDHFLFCDEEYVKIEQCVDDKFLRHSVRLSDGYCLEFAMNRVVEKINSENKNLIALKNIECGQTFYYNDKFYLRTSDAYEHKVIIISLQTGVSTILSDETLVELVDAELIINER